MTDDKDGEKTSPYAEFAKNLKKREGVAHLSAHAYLTSSRNLERKMSRILAFSLVASLLLACASILASYSPLGQNQAITTIIAFFSLGHWGFPFLEYLITYLGGVEKKQIVIWDFVHGSVIGENHNGSGKMNCPC